MILLDTNGLSELMRAGGAPAVLAWVDRFPPGDLHTSTISQAEIMSGLAMMAVGKRRFGLEDAARLMFADDFAGRILAFDERAVSHYADIVSRRRRAGRPLASLDAMIAAIARVHDAAVATRNVQDFEGCGIVVHDPWRD